MIDVVVSVVPAGVMSHPFVAAGMDVRSFRMAFPITVGTSLFWSLASLFRTLALLARRSGPGHRRPRMRDWAMGWDVSATNAPHAAASPTPTILRCRRNCDQREREEYTEKVFHFILLNECEDSIWN
jgi:hypothetical protein